MDTLAIDRDVRAVAEFMERTIPKERRTGVLQAAVELSKVLWGEGEHVYLMQEGKVDG